MFSGIGTGEKGIEQAFRAYDLGRSAKSPDATQRRDSSDINASNGNGRRSDSSSECIGFSEIDKHAAAIYKFHYPEHRNFGDATRIVCDDLDDFDFLIGGFPCQSFSIAGKRQGFNEARGTLFFEIARILSHKRPGHFLLENVRGLLSHDGGKTVHTILRILAELDYFCELVVLNSKDYGVPQNRERCFFIGHLADRCAGEILSVGHGDQETFPARAIGAISGTISTKNQSGQCNFDGSTTLIMGKDGRQKNQDYASCLTGGGHSGGNHSDMDLITVGTLRTHKDGEGFREMQSGLAPALTARARQDGSGQGVIAIPVLTPDRETKRQNGRRFKEDGEPAFTLTAQDRHGVATSDSRIRRLTPIECERLQGCPDNFTKYGRYGDEVKEVADTNRYKGLGNAFTVNVIEAIVSKMIEKGCLK